MFFFGWGKHLLIQEVILGRNLANDLRVSCRPRAQAGCIRTTQTHQVVYMERGKSVKKSNKYTLVHGSSLAAGKAAQHPERAAPLASARPFFPDPLGCVPQTRNQKQTGPSGLIFFFPHSLARAWILCCLFMHKIRAWTHLSLYRFCWISDGFLRFQVCVCTSGFRVGLRFLDCLDCRIKLVWVWIRGFLYLGFWIAWIAVLNSSKPVLKTVESW
jgi:hypothetical protein